MIEYQEARKIAGMLAAVGEPTRMLILHRLAQGPHFVGQLAELIDIPMVNMSHHLGVMKQAGLLDDVKNGRRVIYSLRADVFTPGGGGDVVGTLQVGAMRLVLVQLPNGQAKKRGKKKGDE